MVASSVIRQQAKIGIIQAEVYDSFNSVTKDQLKVLLKSRINEVSHVSKKYATIITFLAHL